MKIQHYRSLFLAWTLSALLVAVVEISSAQTSKLALFQLQYKALKTEAVEMWKEVQQTDLSNDFGLLSLREEILNLVKRINSFSEGVLRYDLQQMDESIQQGRVPKSSHELVILSKAAQGMQQTLWIGSEYLSHKKAIYLRVALKYEEIWKILEEEAFR